MGRVLLALLGAILGAVLLPSAAAARDDAFAPGSVCHAAASADESYAALAATPQRWICRNHGWSIATPRSFVRFDLRGRAGPAPDTLVTRLTRFAALRLIAIATDGSMAARELHQDDVRAAAHDWLMSAALPDGSYPPQAIVLQVDGARHVGLLTDAKLSRAADAGTAVSRLELVMAALCGLFCAPLVFNLAFFRVLRERFLLWHTAAALCMIVQTLVTSGVINRFAALSLGTLCQLSAWSFAGGIVAAALFSADLIEPGNLDPRHRRLLAATALWIPGWTAFYLFADGPFRSLSAPLYYASFVVVLVLLASVMVVALRRGSRAVKFQIVAWLPFMIMGVVRVASAVGLTAVPFEVQYEQHLAVAWEIMVTALAVVDRFMILREQRDTARIEVRSLEKAADRDPLTGLLNRRAIEPRFADLHDAGFTSMAVIDLDHFKAINDTHGHAVGDRVLRAVALALAPDAETLVVRMGGEEFLLLLRGGDALNRAEQRRQAIPARIASEVPGLPGLVTASMGLIEHEAGARLRGEFVPLYERCDRLLYEAKRTGRNRSVCERVQSFAHGPQRRRPQAA
ncbi:MAG: diguanylate cyclase [Novosphingobium sp.]|nr:diguanylate cyclase [Novosphingobium sp.]